nr:hypothetical protein [Moraxella osloensis]
MALFGFLNKSKKNNSKEDLIAKKYNISFERGLSVEGLCVADFNYLAQSYSRHNLVKIADLLNMNREERLKITTIMAEEMSKDSSINNYREKVTNAKQNFDNLSKIIAVINSYADEKQQ